MLILNSRIAFLLCLLGHFSIGSFSSDSSTQFASVSGDVFVGALFPIHTYGNIRNPCAGKIQDENGIQLLEAMFFTLDKINKDKKILAGMKLGVMAADSCDSDIVALERSLYFTDYTRDESSEFTCADGSVPSKRKSERIAGVIGAASSVVSIQLAKFLRLFHVPQISYVSTSPELSNTEKYPYFLRTVPSDIHQAAAIASVLEKMKWEYVSIVYDDTSYGMEGYEQLERYNICFATRQKIRKYDSFNYTHLIEDLNNAKTRVVVLYADASRVEQIFKAADRLNMKDRFDWIGSDAWTDQRSITNHLQKVGTHALGIIPLIREPDGFKEYFQSLNPQNNKRNLWFKEYWENKFACSLDKKSSLNKFSKHCTGKESIDKDFQPTSKSFYVSNSVLAYAYALNELQENLCGSTKTFCDAMRNAKDFRQQLLEKLKKIKFPDSSRNRETFSFEHGRNGPPLYSIMHFNENDEWEEVGTYDDEEKKLDFFKNFEESIEKMYNKSTCSDECKSHEAKIYTNTCCWRCEKCGEYERVLHNSCEECNQGYKPSTNRSMCVPIPQSYISFSDPLAIGMTLLCSIGIILSIFVGCVYYKYRDTPVIKASSTELSSILLIGIIISYAATYVIVAKPSPGTCGLTRYFLGLGSTVSYTAILIKTNRLWRIFRKGMSGGINVKYTSPFAMILMSSVTILVEIILISIWTAIDTPEVEHIYPKRHENVLVCKDAMAGVSYLIPLVFPLLLMILCIFHAIKTRRTPDGFNEARFIGLCTYATSVMWLAFFPVFFSSESYKLRVVTLSLSLFMTATVSLVCLFFTRVYLVLFKPERNTKENVMATSRVSSMPIQGIDSILDNLSNFTKLEALTGSTMSLNIMDKKRLSRGSNTLCPRIRITSVSESNICDAARKSDNKKSFRRVLLDKRRTVCQDGEDTCLHRESQRESGPDDVGGNNNMDYLTVEDGVARHKLKPTLSIRL